MNASRKNELNVSIERVDRILSGVQASCKNIAADIVRDIKRDYEVLLGELTQYNPELLDKSRILAITKCDMLDNDLIEEMKAHLPEGIDSVFISSVAGLNIAKLKDMLWNALHE